MAYVGLYQVLTSHDPKTLRDVMTQQEWLSQEVIAEIAGYSNVDATNFQQLLDGNDQALSEDDCRKLANIIQQMLPLGR